MITGTDAAETGADTSGQMETERSNFLNKNNNRKSNSKRNGGGKNSNNQSIPELNPNLVPIGGVRFPGHPTPAPYNPYGYPAHPPAYAGYGYPHHHHVAYHAPHPNTQIPPPRNYEDSRPAEYDPQPRYGPTPVPYPVPVGYSSWGYPHPAAASYPPVLVSYPHLQPPPPPPAPPIVTSSGTKPTETKTAESQAAATSDPKPAAVMKKTKSKKSNFQENNQSNKKKDGAALVGKNLIEILSDPSDPKLTTIQLQAMIYRQRQEQNARHRAHLPQVAPPPQPTFILPNPKAKSQQSFIETNRTFTNYSVAGSSVTYQPLVTSVNEKEVQDALQEFYSAFSTEKSAPQKNPGKDSGKDSSAVDKATDSVWDSDEDLKTLKVMKDQQKEFERMYSEWEQQFEVWKQNNSAHPKSIEVETQWNDWRKQLLDRRSKMHQTIAELITKIAQKKRDHEEKMKAKNEPKKDEVTASSIVDRLLNQPSIVNLLKSQLEMQNAEKISEDEVQEVPAPPKKPAEVVNLDEGDDNNHLNPSTSYDQSSTQPPHDKRSGDSNRNPDREKLSDDEYEADANCPETSSKRNCDDEDPHVVQKRQEEEKRRQEFMNQFLSRMSQIQSSAPPQDTMRRGGQNPTSNSREEERFRQIADMEQRRQLSKNPSPPPAEQMFGGQRPDGHTPCNPGYESDMYPQESKRDPPSDSLVMRVLRGEAGGPFTDDRNLRNASPPPDIFRGHPDDGQLPLFPSDIIKGVRRPPDDIERHDRQDFPRFEFSNFPAEDYPDSHGDFSRRRENDYRQPQLRDDLYPEDIPFDDYYPQREPEMMEQEFYPNPYEEDLPPSQFPERPFGRRDYDHMPFGPEFFEPPDFYPPEPEDRRIQEPLISNEEFDMEIRRINDYDGWRRYPSRPNWRSRPQEFRRDRFERRRDNHIPPVSKAPPIKKKVVETIAAPVKQAKPPRAKPTISALTSALIEKNKEKPIEIKKPTINLSELKARVVRKGLSLYSQKKAEIKASIETVTIDD